MNLLDLLFPRNCLECKKAGEYICTQCLAKVEQAKLICPLCKKYSFNGKTHSFCANKSPLDGLYSFYKYEGVIRKAILRIKYNFAYDVAGELVNNLKGEVNLGGAILVPVPLHKKRENWRGFNQSTILAKLLAEKNKWTYQNNLVLRLENTIPQARLGKNERMRNISGKFAVNNEILPQWIDRTIVIFDDVWTTGATMSELANELKEAGIKRVWGMSVARS